MTDMGRWKRFEFTGPGVERKRQNILSRWIESDFPRRMRRKEAALWFDPPRPEIADRLGWLDLPENSAGKTEEWGAFKESVLSEGFETMVLLGMGGSSLAPEVFESLCDVRESGIPLVVCDSTHPDAVADITREIEGRKTLFCVSSKSGTTLETLALFHHFWAKASERSPHPGSVFTAVTDEGSPLHILAGERRFRRVFHAPSDVGGRFSALSAFGLVPAAISGLDIPALLGRITTDSDEKSDYFEGLRLGALLAALAEEQNKLTFVTSPALAFFPDWLEQLIAESSGKSGRGLCPVCHEPPVLLSGYGRDRTFVYLGLQKEWSQEQASGRNEWIEAGFPVLTRLLDDVKDIGAEMYRWETAVAAACAAIGVHPFDQPDVQAAKTAAREAMAGSGGRAADSGDSAPFSVAETEETGRRLDGFLKERTRGDYIALQAFLKPGAPASGILQRVRRELLERTGLATTLGFGPRYLHSTGQLHKGGPNTGLFIQLLDDPREDVPVPGEDYTFGAVIAAQAEGDFQALRQKNRRVIRIHLGRNVEEGLERLIDIVR